ncbi:MAG: hypothetical protein A3J29_00190 [Acidobacteria bacterium RIFCSPLOWO2_12_FULL_67_14b]|nr:MAG: hypothetical protein A3J29_00190 [Acidobacteria bacterium RIFCSPLOWO2_12_FULL_67_14b]
MNEQNRFGEHDHEPLEADDLLARAIGEWRDETPARDLWPGVAARLDTAGVRRPRQIAFTLPQLAMAASLLIAVASGLTWLAARPAAPAGDGQEVVLAESEPAGLVQGDVQNANFADAQFDAAVTDLERILREDRDRLDPRTVLVIERNLQAIDDAIREARMALNDDPANTYLNSHLADARRRKLELLRHVTTLASAGGD